MPITKEAIIKGIDHREDVFLPAYQDVVTVRPLSDIEMAECRSEAGILGIMGEIGIDPNTSMDEDRLNKLITDKPEVLTKLDRANQRLYRSLAKRGVVNQDLREMVDNPSRDLPGEPSKVMAVELLMSGSLQIIGQKILEISMGDIKNFLTQSKENSS